MRGPTLFKGYWKAAKPMRATSVMRFLYGHLFRRQTDGTYDFVDRAKYMIQSGGENIYPAEIDRVLLAIPASAIPWSSARKTRNGGRCRWPSYRRSAATWPPKISKSSVAAARRLQTAEGSPLHHLR